MNIMSGIREEFIEEAVSWDGSERKRIRQIRRMTTGFGAVAAAIAVVVGTIAYKERNDDFLAADSQESETESVTEDTTLNLFGGHGDIEVVKSLWCDNFYRDDDYWYDGTVKWSVRSGGKALPCTTVSSMLRNKMLYADDQQLYRVHDGKIFVTDGFGNETELVDMNKWKSGNGGLYEIAENLQRIQKVGDALLLECYSTEVTEHVDDEVLDAENLNAEGSDDENLNCCAFSYDVICVNLKDGSANTMENAESTVVAGSDDTGFYTYSYKSHGFHRFDFNGKIQGNEPVWAFTDDVSLMYTKYADGKLYAVLSYYDYNFDPVTNEEIYETTRPEYHIYDIASGDETTISMSSDENVLIGKMLYRARFEDGRFVIDRYTLDMEEQREVYAVTASEVWDTKNYSLPNISVMNIAEADGEMLIVLPNVLHNGDTVPTLHGEAMAVVDISTGKVIYSGRDYNRQNDNTAVTTNADDTAEDSTSQTAVSLEGNANFLGGTGVLEPLGCSMLWADDTRVYNLQNGTVCKKPASGSGIMEQEGFICTEPGCQHDSDKCFAYRWNIADINTQEQNVRLLTDGSDVFGVKGGKCWRIDPVTGEDTLCMEITKQPDGGHYGQDEIQIQKLTPMQVHAGAGVSRNSAFIVDYVTDPVADGFKTRNLAFCDCTTGEIRPFLMQENMNGGLFIDGTDWDKVETDDKNPEYAYVLKDQHALIVLYRDGSIRDTIELPLADGSFVSYEEWVVYDGKVYYQTESGQYFRYTLSTGENQMLSDASPVKLGHGRWYELDGVVIVPDLQTGSQNIIVSNPDFSAESMQYTTDESAPLYGISGIARKNDQFTVAFASGDKQGLYTFQAPEWAN